MPANQAPPTDPATPAAATERQPRGTEAMMAPPVKAPTAPTQIVIEVTYGAKTSTYTLLPGDNVVGRQSLKGGPPPTILLEDADQRYVSRKHIHIQVQDERWVVIDTSTNGTEYNGARMVPSKSYPLKVGDKIVIEDRQLLVKSIS
jgi:pSer/pThr/pTyr-binding forkhead associated (FHA) protein